MTDIIEPNTAAAAAAQADQPPVPSLSREAIAVLFATCVSGFLFQVDLTALSAALPDIATSLAVAAGAEAWVIDAYSLALIFALPIAGPLADRYGRRASFLAGAVLFGLASVLCATASGLSGLLAWRALQGVAGAALTSSAVGLVAAAVPAERRAWAFGILGTVIGASMVAGPPFGALLAAGLGWPAIFWINVPICLLLVVLLWRLAADTPAAAAVPLDLAGPAALATAMGSLAFALIDGESGWRVPVIAVSAAMLVLFVVAERRHPSPAFDFRLFGSARFVAMCLVPIAGSIGYWALLVHLPGLARGPLGLGPGAAGLLLTSLTVPMLLLPGLGARIATRLPARLYFGGGVAIIGLSDLLLAAASWDLSGPAAIWTVAGALLLGGSGCALFNSQITAAAVAAVPTERAATASAMCVTMRQIGFAFGIALIAACLKAGGEKPYPAAFAAAGACALVLAGLSAFLLGRAQST